ncbi:MAG: hypothetical protein QNJ62_09345 [Methyloceanibacter sp.]|nr:hypothetical protein [Methyloceanibacter sp.]
MAIENPRVAPRNDVLHGFFASYRWPLAFIVALTAISVAAFTPRFIGYLSEGHRDQATTKAFEFALITQSRNGERSAQDV